MKIGQLIGSRFVAAILLVLLVPVSRAAGQFDGRMPRRAASATITLIATLEALGVTVTAVDVAALLPAAGRSRPLTYAITTRSAVLANRTTIRVSCFLRSASAGSSNEEGKQPAVPPAIQEGSGMRSWKSLDPKPDRSLPLFAVRAGEDNQPAVRTDFLNIRLDNTASSSALPVSPPEQLNIVAQAF